VIRVSIKQDICEGNYAYQSSGSKQCFDFPSSFHIMRLLISCILCTFSNEGQGLSLVIARAEVDFEVLGIVYVFVVMVGDKKLSDLHNL
jgi:hypothetical protein